MWYKYTYSTYIYIFGTHVTFVTMCFGFEKSYTNSMFYYYSINRTYSLHSYGSITILGSEVGTCLLQVMQHNLQSLQRLCSSWAITRTKHIPNAASMLQVATAMSTILNSFIRFRTGGSGYSPTAPIKQKFFLIKLKRCFENWEHNVK